MLNCRRSAPGTYLCTGACKVMGYLHLIKEERNGAEERAVRLTTNEMRWKDELPRYRAEKCDSKS